MKDVDPRSVKDILKEMKDLSELMVDLAYSAVLYDDEDIAEEVLRLEEQMDGLLYHARVAAMLGARNPRQAKALSGVLQIVSSAEKVSDAAGDIAKVVLLKLELPRELKADLSLAEETIVRLKVKKDSKLAGKTLAKLRLETETGMKVIAIRRGLEWIFDPKKNTRLLREDIIFARGPSENIPHFYELASGEKYQRREYIPHEKIAPLEKAVDLIIEMKNLSELATSLAYSAVLFNNEEIAHEVKTIEEEMDNLHHQLGIYAFESAKYVEDVSKLRGLLHLSESSEAISDAAYSMADIVLREIEPHPAFMLAVRESDEIISRVVVGKRAQIADKKIKDLHLETEIIAIRRGEKWIFNPKDETVIKGNDSLIVKGTRMGEELLLKICR
jgi:uncharacterized protein with PhoU and TrkA domain